MAESVNISVESFNRICRACLCESSSMRSLFTERESDNTTLLDIFNLASNLSSGTASERPHQVCRDCEVFICKVEEFRNLCLQSEMVLKKVFESSRQGQYFDSKLVNDDKNEIFLNTSDFELHVVGKKDIDDFSNSFVAENFKLKTAPIKHEAYENDDFSNDFDTMELSIEFKEEEKPRKTLRQKKSKSELKPRLKMQPNLSCQSCNVTFESLYLWQDHQEAVHQVKISEKSRRIAMGLDPDSAIKKTKDSKHTKEVYQCPHCTRELKTKKTLARHIKIHDQTETGKFACEKCKREFKYKSFLENHIISAHMHNEFTCHLCPHTFETKEALSAHIDAHIDKKKHVCEVCNKAFIMMCTLKDHMRKHTGEKPFLCAICGKGFSQKANMRQHWMRHMGKKDFKCDICSKGFVSKGELDAHNRKHSGDHPFVCDDCGHGFTTASALKKHRRTHTGERPYACDLCPMRFAASGTLKNHRRTHTGERPFQCSYCEKAFVQRTDLISHIRCHTGERPYTCSTCGQSFRKAAALKTHLKMHSKDSGMLQGMLLSVHDGLSSR